MFIDELEQAGHRLFRFRSYVFFILAPLAILALTARHDYLWHSQSVEKVYEYFCFAVSMLGLTVRMLSIGYAQPGTSGRNTKEQVADSLNTGGMYSLCRHPLYLGNFLMAAGIFLLIGSYWLVVVGLLLYIVVYERIIITEEGFLARKFGESFHEWTKHTPCVLPRFRQWTSGGKFSFKAAVRGEIYGFTAVVAMFFALITAKDFWIQRTFQIDYFWTIFLAVTIPLFFLLRFLRKSTSLLDPT